MAIDDTGKYEIDFRLRQKERELQQAVTIASGVKIEALADDGVVVPGQPVKVNVIVANRGTAEVAIKQVKIDGFEGDPSTLRDPQGRPEQGRGATGSGQAPACTMTAFTGGGFAFPGGGRGGRGRGGNAPPPQPLWRAAKDQVAAFGPPLTGSARAPLAGAAPAAERG